MKKINKLKLATFSLTGGVSMLGAGIIIPPIVISIRNNTPNDAKTLDAVFGVVSHSTGLTMAGTFTNGPKFMEIVSFLKTKVLAPADNHVINDIKDPVTITGGSVTIGLVDGCTEYSGEVIVKWATQGTHTIAGDIVSAAVTFADTYTYSSLPTVGKCLQKLLLTNPGLNINALTIQAASGSSALAWADSIPTGLWNSSTDNYQLKLMAKPNTSYYAGSEVATCSLSVPRQSLDDYMSGTYSIGNAFRVKPSPEQAIRYSKKEAWAASKTLFTTANITAVVGDPAAGSGTITATANAGIKEIDVGTSISIAYTVGEAQTLQNTFKNGATTIATAGEFLIDPVTSGTPQYDVIQSSIYALLDATHQSEVFWADISITVNTTEGSKAITLTPSANSLIYTGNALSLTYTLST